MDAVIQVIQESVESLKAHPSFVQWYSQAGVDSGDLILVNNSFVYRDVTTSKSRRYLAFRVGENGTIEPAPWIVDGYRMNADLKRLGTQSQSALQLTSLEDAVRAEALPANSLAFVLIAHVDDSVVLERPLQTKGFDRIVWDPATSASISIQDGVITVRDIYDEESIWSEVVAHFRRTGQEVPPSLMESISKSLDQLQEDAVAELHFPSEEYTERMGMTDAIVNVLQEQRSQYAQALQECDFGSRESSPHYNEILRIAYNFASDATMFLRLVVSICDLRPIVLWGTIGEHFALSEAFEALPSAHRQRKFSLKNYARTIGDARNSAFHNLFPFRKTLSLALPAAALQNASLRLFVEHGKKKQDRLTYQDKELVDVLLEFTRARYRRAPSRFWQKNLAVMDATITLFSRTSDFLKALHRLALSSLRTQS